MTTEKIPAKKSLGQHFLKNESVINKIIELGDFPPTTKSWKSVRVPER